MAAPITNQHVQIVSSVQKEEGRWIIAEALEWKAFDEEVEIRKSILLDFLYDHCKFAVDKGFSLKQINAVIQFAEEFLQETKGLLPQALVTESYSTSKTGLDYLSEQALLHFPRSTQRKNKFLYFLNTVTQTVSEDNDLTVPKALLTFKDKSDSLIPVLGGRNFKIYSEFMFSTYMRHFQLFKLVFTTDRTADFSSFSQTVEVPPEPIEFKDGKNVKIWEYEQKIEEMEKKESELANEQCERKSKLIEQTEQLKSEILKDSDDTENQLTKEELEKLVKEVIGQYSEAHLKILQSSVTDTQESLQVKLEKACIPRPLDSGPLMKTGNTKAKNTSAALKSTDSPGKSAKSRK